jgi:hypothetical protein
VPRARTAFSIRARLELDSPLLHSIATMNFRRLLSLSPSRSLIAALALSLVGLTFSSALASCGSTHKVRGADNEGLSAGRLATVNPLEIVVPRIENQSSVTGLPLDSMRSKFHAGLVKLRYTPLALDYVDRSANVVDASYRPGELGEQATLRVVLTGWDDSLWKSRSRLVVDADVYLLDAREPELTKALWGGHVTRTIDLSKQAAAIPTSGALLERAVTEFVDGVLASLPARNPER